MSQEPSHANRTSGGGKELRLDRLRISNFKGIDELKLDFPPPKMSNDPDVFLMGSRNGLGKTSVLESCALLFLAAAARGEDVLPMRRFSRHSSMDVPDLLIRAGSKEAVIQGDFTIGRESHRFRVIMKRTGEVATDGSGAAIRQLLKRSKVRPFEPAEASQRFFLLLSGLVSDPLLTPPLMYFHSYRKVQEGNPELGMMVEPSELDRRYRYRGEVEQPISTLKLEILRSLMSRGGLFENLDDTDAESVLETLNYLMDEYAGGHIEKLRPSRDNTVEFRIRPRSGTASFTFDGLSSGQKEIIATLFLIWRYTRNQQGIVLIDEPELHLNAEWHSEFVRQLHKLAPSNQYILATHSEDIFASVPPDRRLLLIGDRGAVR